MPKRTTETQPDVAAALTAELVKNDKLTKQMSLVSECLDSLRLAAIADPPRAKPNMQPGDYTLLTISTLAARLHYISDRLDVLQGDLDVIDKGDD